MSQHDFTKMKVQRLVLDPNSNSPIVILHDEDSGALLPIWIGIFEAHSIAMKMEGIESPRPMTHDLLSNTIDAFAGMVEKVEVTDLVDNTYLARIYFMQNDHKFSVDSRPSDAIALALRGESPIFVANHVLEQSKIDPADIPLDDVLDDVEDGELGESKEDEWTKILKEYNPSGGKDKLN